MTRHARAAAAIIEILRDAGDVGIAALCRDEIESALERESPEPEPHFLTADHGRMLREMVGSLHYFDQHKTWIAVIKTDPLYSHTATSHNAAAAVEAAYARFKETNKS